MESLQQGFRATSHMIRQLTCVTFSAIQVQCSIQVHTIDGKLAADQDEKRGNSVCPEGKEEEGGICHIH